MRNDIKFNYHELLSRIQSCATSNGRLPNDTTLLAVSKKQSIDKIRDCYHLGQRAFGENYIQEMLEKKAQLTDLEIEWHFIGAFQSNKSALIAEHCSWLHTLTSIKGADKLNRHRDAQSPKLNCCIQFNAANDPNKAGIQDDESLLLLAQHVSQLPHLKLRGLMTIPDSDPQSTAQAFAKLNEKLQWLQTQLPDQTLDTLSMGMSADLELAIANGSTMVRVGSALFGNR